MIGCLVVGAVAGLALYLVYAAGQTIEGVNEPGRGKR